MTRCAAGLVFLIVLASLAGVGCSLVSDRLVVRNESDDFVLVRVEQVSCREVRPGAFNNWSIVDGRSTFSQHTVHVGEACVIFANPARTSFATAPFDGGDEYIVRNSGNRITVLQRSPAAEGEAPHTPASRGVPADQYGASPKLWWVIGLPAALSGVYVVYIASSFVGLMLGRGKHRPSGAKVAS